MANRINSIFTIEDTFLAYAVGDSGLAVASSDGGATWRRLELPYQGNLYTICFPGQGTVGYACGDLGAVLKTEDGGKTWRMLGTGVRVDLRVVKFPVGPQIGFVAGDAGTILRTDDAGKTWDKLAVATDQKIMDMNFPSDEATGYAVGPNGTVLKTTTGGSIWFSQAGNLDGVMLSTNITAVFFPAGDTVGFATTTNAGILFTPDGGEEWRPLSFDFMPPALFSLDFRRLWEEQELPRILGAPAAKGWKLSWPSLLGDLAALKAVQITLDGRSYTIRTELEGDCYKGFQAVGLRPPGRVQLEDSPEMLCH